MFKSFIIQTIRFYQVFISPSLGQNCRFSPSCSQYAEMAVKRYGAAKGFLRAIQRLLKCHPLNKGGTDLP